MRNPTVVPSDVPGHFSGPVVDPPKDPVCGMTVGPDSVFRHSHRNRTFVFCSEECLARFKANPVLYAGNDIPGPVTLVKFPQRAEGDTGTGTYTCPMHPEVVRDSPGSCPKCGMALELRTAVGGEGEQENSEFVDMRRRFLVSAILTAPLFLVAMGDFIPGHPFEGLFPGSTLPWVEFLLATPVVLWGGWPFFVRGWHSVVNRSLNMFTLIALGVGVAYLYSLFAVLFPGIFPPLLPRCRGDGCRLFRGGGRHRHPRAPRAGPGTEGPQPDGGGR